MARAYVFNDDDPVPATERTDGREPVNEFAPSWDDDEAGTFEAGAFAIPGEPAREDFSIPRGQGGGASTATLSSVLKEVYQRLGADELAKPPINPKNIYGRVAFTKATIEATRDARPGSFWGAAIGKKDPNSGALTFEMMQEAIDRIAAGPAPQPTQEDRNQLRALAAERRYISDLAFKPRFGGNVPRGTVTPNEAAPPWILLPAGEEQLEQQTEALKKPSVSTWIRFTSALRRK